MGHLMEILNLLLRNRQMHVFQYLHFQNKDVCIVGDFKFNIHVAEAMLPTDGTVSDFHNMFLSYYRVCQKKRRHFEHTYKIWGN